MSKDRDLVQEELSKMKVSKKASMTLNPVTTIHKEEVLTPDEEEEVATTTLEMKGMVATNLIVRVTLTDQTMMEVVSEMNVKEVETITEIEETNDIEMTVIEWIVVNKGIVTTEETWAENTMKSVVKEEWIEIGVEEEEGTINTHDQILLIQANLAHHIITTILIEEVEEPISSVREEGLTMVEKTMHHLLEETKKKTNEQILILISYVPSSNMVVTT